MSEHKIDSLSQLQASQVASYCRAQGPTVRLIDQGHDLPLCTSAYCTPYPMDVRCDVARRIAAAWNYFVGIPTSAIEGLNVVREAKPK